ncbi:MAG: type II secretion system F family protein, partial [Thermaurantiacus tibetensis]
RRPVGGRDRVDARRLAGSVLGLARLGKGRPVPAAAAAARVRAGAGFAPSLALLPRAPALLLSLARSGEASGRLAPLLDSAAQAIDRQLSDRSRVLLSLLEPLIIVVLGGVVGLIILAVLLPILRLNALASQAIGAS